MKHLLLVLSLSLSLGVTVALAHAAETAQVTLTVTKLGAISPQGDLRLVDYKASMTAHDTVSLIDSSGMPTFVCEGAVDFNVTIASTDGKIYRPLAVSFQQIGDLIPVDQKDPVGAENFVRLSQSDSTISFRSKGVRSGAAGQYEYFILVQDVASGNIGLIDPVVVIKTGQN